MQGQQVILLEDMFNEQIQINGKSLQSTQISVDFVNKLNRLDLIEEFSEQQSQFGLNTGVSYKINQALVSQAHGSRSKPIQSKTFVLKRHLSRNLMSMLDQELKLDYLKKKSSENKEEELFGQLDRAKHKWERLTHFMLNIDQMQTSMDGMFALNQQIVNMLVEANLLQVNPEFNF